MPVNKRVRCFLYVGPTCLHVQETPCYYQIIFTNRKMTKYLILFLLLFSLKTTAQKVTVTGTAFDTTNGRNWVRIILNDTIRKFIATKKTDWDTYRKIIEDSTLSVFAKENGKFKITAQLTDSLVFHADRSIQQVHAVADLLKMDSINIRLEPEVCITYVPCGNATPSNVYVFIGEKVQVNQEPEIYYCNYYTWDPKFKAEYKILKNVVANFPKDTIKFTVYDHYGTPHFSQYKNVLLFVSEYCGKLLHEKYQFFDLYQTVDGKWASPGDPYKYDNYHRKNLTAKKMQFPDSVRFDISKLTQATIQELYPSPFYKIQGQYAIPVMGSYVEDLIAVKRNGVLKARNIILN